MDPDTEREKWEARYRAADSAEAQPARVLEEFAHLLPARGDALDLACGLGGNALLLARRGLQTRAWDRSGEAIARLAAQAHAEGLPLTAEVRDVLSEPPPAERFDVIVVSRFLERSLFAPLAAALRPGGLLFYQTFVHEAVGTHGPRRSAYRLRPNELLHAFAELRLLVYREEGRIGDCTHGLRDEALLIACRC